MVITDGGLPGVLHVLPEKKTDARGSFFESLRVGRISAAAGHRFSIAQVNYSVSARGTLRGLHGVALRPGQSKFVSCVRGALQDIVVDLRVGSPTFGEHTSSVLDAESGRGVYVAEGLFHGFVALADDTCISYLCSTSYVPGTQIDIDPLDPGLKLPWRLETEPTLSEKDAAAPSVAQARRAGLLPRYAECLALYEELGRRTETGTGWTDG
ncbi:MULTISPECIES: dTDP-4-dehydrorhamnose 3,5-epimerase family protein [Amycolatopsis]|uniref:dTDP-4-dehydrorhamnose 3,5-epimerase family protein n=1 Tax=Amycolatopsis sp. cg13 TaxID=3238807 RepID=UPI003524757B